MHIRLMFCVTAMAVAAGCGPVQSMTVIWEASAELEGAKAADGRKFAPYEIVAAEVYLDKALEEQAYADFEPSIVFGTQALEMSRKAKEKTASANRRAAPPSAPPPGAMAPPDQGGVTPVHIVPVPEAGAGDSGSTSPPPVIVPVPE